MPPPSQISFHQWDLVGLSVPNFRHVQHAYLCLPHESCLTCYSKVHFNMWLHLWKQVVIIPSITLVKELRLLSNRQAQLKSQVNQAPRNTHNQEDHLIWPKEEFFYYETLEQFSQRSCGRPIIGSVQGQVGQGFEQLGLVEGVPAHGRRVGLHDL